VSSLEGFGYLVVRPGRLVGGPWTNTDVSALLKVDEGSRKKASFVGGGWGGRWRRGYGAQGIILNRQSVRIVQGIVE
jgi:hypothetical protein